MADVVEHTTNEERIPHGKINGALTTGIIGTALGGLMLLGSKNGLGSLFGGNSSDNDSEKECISPDVLFLERKVCQDYNDLTREYYENKIAARSELAQAFFDSYKLTMDNTFNLYDKMNKDYFQNYVAQRDAHDVLSNRINEVDKKVDMIAAIRPYQDALINCKIDNTAMVADFNLQRRTCKMITGEVVLPNTPVVTGYGSYSPFAAYCSSTSGSSSGSTVS